MGNVLSTHIPKYFCNNITAYTHITLILDMWEEQLLLFNQKNSVLFVCFVFESTRKLEGYRLFTLLCVSILGPVQVFYKKYLL